MPMNHADTGNPIPISALQHAVYCLRQAALIHLARLWEENRYTAEGRTLHDVVNEPAQRRRKGIRRVTALPIGSQRLHLAGVADLVEFYAEPDGERAYPVEFKPASRSRIVLTKCSSARKRYAWKR